MRRHSSRNVDQLNTRVSDWNVIVSVMPHRFRAACEILEPLGEVTPTHYQNLLALTVPDVGEFLETLHDWLERYPDTSESISHVSPCVVTFAFASPEEFETELRKAAMQFEPEMAGRSFHVRMHRRGWKGRLATPHEEWVLGEYLLEQFRKTSPQSRVDFADPDVVLDIEVLDNRAGIALWTRANRGRYPFLNVD